VIKLPCVDYLIHYLSAHGSTLSLFVFAVTIAILFVDRDEGKDDEEEEEGLAEEERSK